MNSIQTTLKRGAFVALLAVGIAQGAFADLIGAKSTEGAFDWNGSVLSLTDTHVQTNFSNGIIYSITDVILQAPLTVTDDSDAGDGIYILSGGAFTFKNGLTDVGGLSFSYVTLTKNVIAPNSWVLEAYADTMDGGLSLTGAWSSAYKADKFSITFTPAGADVDSGVGPYTGKIGVTADAVPEPFTISLGCASVVGYAIRRRKATK